MVRCPLVSGCPGFRKPTLPPPLQLLEQHTDPEHPLYIVSPGEFWAMQFLVEVLGIPRHLILLTPNHIIWEIYYPTLYVSFGTLYWAQRFFENFCIFFSSLDRMVSIAMPPPFFEPCPSPIFKRSLTGSPTRQRTFRGGCRSCGRRCGSFRSELHR